MIFPQGFFLHSVSILYQSVSVYVMEFSVQSFLLQRILNDTSRRLLSTGKDCYFWPFLNHNNIIDSLLMIHLLPEGPYNFKWKVILSFSLNIVLPEGNGNIFSPLLVFVVTNILPGNHIGCQYFLSTKLVIYLKVPFVWLQNVHKRKAYNTFSLEPDPSWLLFLLKRENQDERFGWSAQNSTDILWYGVFKTHWGFDYTSCGLIECKYW